MTALAAHSRPLLVEHSRAPFVAEPVADASPDVQPELPLQWANARRPQPDSLRRYPDLPLRAGVPRPEPYVARAAALVADVLAGARPATQVSRVATLEVQQRLGRRGARRAVGPAWTGRAARVSSTSTMVVAGAAAQVAVVFFIGRRAHAAALRMEYRHNRWVVSDVEAAL